MHGCGSLRRWPAAAVATGFPHTGGCRVVVAAAVLLCCCYSHEFSKSVDFFVLLLLSFFTFLFLFAHTVITLFSQDATPLHRLCTIHRGTLFDGMKTRFEGSQILAAQLAAELEIERAQRAEQERLAAEQHDRDEALPWQQPSYLKLFAHEQK